MSHDVLLVIHWNVRDEVPGITCSLHLDGIRALTVSSRRLINSRGTGVTSVCHV